MGEGEGEESPQPGICNSQVTLKKLTIYASAISISILNKMIGSTHASAISRVGSAIRTVTRRDSFIYKKAKSDKYVGKHGLNSPKPFKIELFCSELSPSLSEDPCPVEEPP